MMVGARISAIIRKELAELARNRAAVLPVVVVGLVSTALPFFIAIIVPHLSGHPLSHDSDLTRGLSEAAGDLRDLATLGPEGRIQSFIFSRFLVMTLLVPVTAAITFAGHSVVGEKVSRSLEPLLATPITTSELLIAKVLGRTPAVAGDDDRHDRHLPDRRGDSRGAWRVPARSSPPRPPCWSSGWGR